jgi:hypothetical protein
MKRFSTGRFSILAGIFFVPFLSTAQTAQVTVNLEESAGLCGLLTNCDTLQICLDIVMTTDLTDTLDSYNIHVEYDGTVISRDTFGVNNASPIGDNSCIIDNGNQDTDLEGPSFFPDHWRVAGVNGAASDVMTANVPQTVHTICFRIKQPALLNGQVVCVGGNVGGLLTTVTFFGGNTDINVPETCFTLDEDFISCSLLPVEFLEFKARSQGNTAILNWSTANEFNSDYFEIQRAGADKQFMPIGRVQSIGNSTTAHSYDFIDEYPLTGSNYYRLRQVDIDGKSDYSSIEIVVFDKGISDWKVWPNPARDEVYVDLSAIPAGHYTIFIRSMDGQIMNSVETTPHQSHLKMEIANIPPGLYQVVIQGNAFESVQKVVITE